MLTCGIFIIVSIVFLMEAFYSSSIFGNQEYIYIQTYSGIIQSLSGIFKTLSDPGIFRTLVYSKLQHIWNPRYIKNPINIPFEAIVY